MRLSIRTYFRIAVILSVVGFLDIAFVAQFSAAAGKYIGYLADIIMLFITFMAGRTAKQDGKSALWIGTQVGILFGAITAMSAFFVKTTAAQIREKLIELGNTNPDPNAIAHGVALANSPWEHMGVVIVSLLVYGVIGLVVGLIGGSTTTKRQ